MGKGRKRKAGVIRTKTGRISRSKEAIVVTFDQGTDRAREKHSVYGTDGSDAIGRAYRKGLLGDDGQLLMQVARAIFRAYWPMLAVGAYSCPLGSRTGGSAFSEPENAKDREVWLTDALRKVERMGREYRRAFDQLVIEINPDCGPSWLDGLIWANDHGKPIDPAHQSALTRALAALVEVAPKQRRAA